MTPPMSHEDAVDAYLTVCALFMESKQDDAIAYLQTFDLDERLFILTNGATVTNGFAASHARRQGIAWDDIGDWIRSCRYDNHTTTTENGEPNE
ncbi:hypothetical protein [Gordonia zhaorongruii]|uniref:hypothetical protein n=1 Tax=Gordonia zhaorongruii TaxID=2597659 RepID=UPI00117CFADD|nr:hypothetical protein [Gordonia zhaorongruii]